MPVQWSAYDAQQLIRRSGRGQVPGPDRDVPSWTVWAGGGGGPGFLTTLASSPGTAAWQVEQATDALTLLLGSVRGQEWGRTIPAAGQTRSRIIAIPWPTPMHMVQRA